MLRAVNVEDQISVMSLVSKYYNVTQF